MKYNYNAVTFAKRNKNLTSIGFKDYQEYLKSDTWKTIKRKVARHKSPFWKICYICGGTEGGIQLHHIKYRKMQKTTLLDIKPACRRCHEAIHDYSRIHNVSFKSAGRRLKKLLSKS